MIPCARAALAICVLLLLSITAEAGHRRYVAYGQQPQSVVHKTSAPLQVIAAESGGDHVTFPAVDMQREMVLKGRPVIGRAAGSFVHRHQYQPRKEVMPPDGQASPVAWPRSAPGTAADYRPHAWCGWWMRQQLGVSDRRFNLARNWARWGRPAGGPQVGAIVVWPHHIGRIVGPCQGHVCLIQSGNDGHAVRTRERSIAGAIAFRVPG